MDTIFLDPPDVLVRQFTGRSHWPPYSLRAFVGGARDFGSTGGWFERELDSLHLLARGTRILDIGCGCGRIAYPLATAPSQAERALLYTGMDVDYRCVEWCRRHITPLNPSFTFYHVDCRNDSYNPRGTAPASQFAFPHEDRSFDLVIATSVFTHLLEDDLRHYFWEISRLLAPSGSAYVSLFLFDSERDLAQRSFGFGPIQGNCAVSQAGIATNAVAYRTDFLLNVLASCGLTLVGPVKHGYQDNLLLHKTAESIELVNGWHSIENGSWRWTERQFSARTHRSDSKRHTLRFRFHLPEIMLRETGSIQLCATVDGDILPKCSYSTPGEHVYIQPIRSAGGSDPISIEFRIDAPDRPISLDARELGVQVSFSAFANSALRQLSPLMIT